MTQPAINVAIGILINDQQQILVGQRPPNTIMPGYWEFPGGKIESGETPQRALHRELAEEIGIDVLVAEVLLDFSYVRDDLPRHIHVWLIKSYHGEPHGREGQPIKWVAISELRDINLLPMNEPIIKALEDLFAA